MSSAKNMFFKFIVLFLFLGCALAYSEPREIYWKSSLQSVKLMKESPFLRSSSDTIERHSSDYCQVRIDFETFEEIGYVNEEGKCEGGQWTLTGQIQDNVPTLCGSNTGQHIYADFEETGTPMIMNITTHNRDSHWSISVLQIACDDELNRVPSSCLQNYESPNGNFKSFGYQNIETNSTLATYQLANPSYFICFGSISSLYSTITYSRPIGAEASNYSFTVTGLVSITDPIYLGTSFVSEFGPTSCTTDYVVITSGTFSDVNSVTTTASLFCGLGFPVTVTSTYQPFQMQVVTDGTESPYDDGNVGFSLFYHLS